MRPDLEGIARPPGSAIAPEGDADAREGEALATLRDAIQRRFPGRIALVSSFGAESAALLRLVAAVNPATPILFNETGMLFPETLAYQRALAAELGLTNVRIIRPTQADLSATDPAADLWSRNPDLCCGTRKVAPLNRALAPFRAWITGRKRFQSGTRQALPLEEIDDLGRIKLNPLAGWSAAEVAETMRRHGLPAHPLVSRGYPSIGCAPCTTPVAAGEDPRAGRWRGSQKTECGIHFGPGGPRRQIRPQP